MPKYCEGTIPELMSFSISDDIFTPMFKQKEIGLPEVVFLAEFSVNREDKGPVVLSTIQPSVLVYANQKQLEALESDYKNANFHPCDIIGRRSALLPVADADVLTRHVKTGASWHWQLVNGLMVKENLNKVQATKGPKNATVIFPVRYMRVGYRPN